MSFCLEKNMTPIVLDHFRCQGYTCWTEAPMKNIFGAQIGYADIIGVQLHENRCRRRLEEGPVTPWGSARDCAKRVLDPPAGSLPDWFPLFGDVVAVELKLSKWEQAIGQASGYRASVKNTYAAFPRDRAEWVLSEKMIDEDFPGDGRIDPRFWHIGIIGVTPDGCEIMRKPREDDAGTYTSHYGHDYDHVSVQNVVNMGERAWRYWKEENDDV